MERTRYRIEIGRHGLEAKEDANGPWVYHADHADELERANATIAALQQQLAAAQTLRDRWQEMLDKEQTEHWMHLQEPQQGKSR